MVNKVILIGNVGMDPEIRTLEGGTKMARLRVATTERHHPPRRLLHRQKHRVRT